MLIRALILMFSLLTTAAAAAVWAQFMAAGGGGGSGGDVAFALPTGSTLKFLSPTGSDSNNGLTPATAWATPNHAMNCGEVILVSPGTYTGGGATAGVFAEQWGPVSNCPSTSGGVDGTGGIWFAIALCAGADLNACLVNGPGSANPPIQVLWGLGQSNWAIEGFKVDSAGNTGAYQIRVTDDNCVRFFKSHHIAVVNSLVFNSTQGYGFNDCGKQQGVATDFADYVAVVGLIAQNANQDAICLGAIDFVGLGNWDTLPGTHAYMYNNYGINNQSPACANRFDGEAFYIDSPDVHLFTQQAVIANNMAWRSTRSCIAMTKQPPASPAGAVFKINNNTCFHNMIGTNDFDQREINLNTGNDGAPWTQIVTKNIAYTDLTSTVGVNGYYALGQWFTVNTQTIGAIGSDGNENIFKATATACISSSGSGFVCDPGFNMLFNDTSVLPSGGNFFENPSFANTADLLANWIGVPNCAGFINTTQCMGWNAATHTLTPLTPIADLQASCAHCAGRGFQLPSTTCAANADYPAWIKGINYLHASGFVIGAAITQKADLATKPCGF